MIQVLIDSLPDGKEKALEIQKQEAALEERRRQQLGFNENNPWCLEKEDELNELKKFFVSSDSANKLKATTRTPPPPSTQRWTRRSRVLFLILPT